MIENRRKVKAEMKVRILGSLKIEMNKVGKEIKERRSTWTRDCK